MELIEHLYDGRMLALFRAGTDMMSENGSRSAIQRTYDRYSRLEPMRNALERYENHLRNILREAPLDPT